MAQFDDSFWGEYTEGGDGGDFVTEIEMLTYVANGTVLQLTGVREGSGNYGPQWFLDFIDGKGAEKTKSFKKGIGERDARLERIRETLETSGEPIAAKFIKLGRRYDVTGA